MRPGIVATNRRRTPAAPPGDPTVRAVKHYVIARLRDGAHVRTVKHYVIAEPS